MQERVAALPSHNDGVVDYKWTSVMDRREMEEVCKEFYTNLFVSHVDIPAPHINLAKEQALPVMISEVQNAAYK